MNIHELLRASARRPAFWTSANHRGAYFSSDIFSPEEEEQEAVGRALSQLIKRRIDRRTDKGWLRRCHGANYGAIISGSRIRFARVRSRWCHSLRMRKYQTLVFSGRHRNYPRQMERAQVVEFGNAKFGCWLASAVYREHRFLVARAPRWWPAQPVFPRRMRERKRKCDEKHAGIHRCLQHVRSSKRHAILTNK